jgi:hypothetical protein
MRAAFEHQKTQPSCRRLFPVQRTGFVKRFILICLGLLAFSKAARSQASRPPGMKLSRLLESSGAELLLDGKSVTVKNGDRIGVWTLVDTVPASPRASSQSFVVLEDYTQRDGHLIFVNAHGIRGDLAKSSEPTSADPAKLYLGHTPQEILDSPRDLLADQILSSSDDPSYDEIASAFEPISKMQTYSFVGTPDTYDKIGFAYGGRSPNFDPAPYESSIAKIREQRQVLDGLVGGYLPVLRFVYPQEKQSWTEMIAFAPWRISNGNDHVQPVWYRVSRIENGRLKWAKYIDSYHPFPPRTGYDPKLFYSDLAALSDRWNQFLAPGMKIDLPDERLANMARYALVRARMTRVGDFPKYGAVDKDYAGSEHDGFPDSFTADTTAMLEWGLLDLAARYIENYFAKFVRDDGSLLYRGPEVGQYGRMLTVAAEYVNYGGHPDLLLRYRTRIDGITNLLLGLRNKGKTLPFDDPAYGMLAGWSEADASLDPAPQRYMQPYFSNSTEAARGFRDVGRVWEKIGRQNNDSALVAWGRRLQREADELLNDLNAAFSRSILAVGGEKILPAIAGAKEPFHIAVPRDNTDPQFRSYRAYAEMLYSGSLSKDQVRTIADYRASHHDTILGVPTAYGYRTADLAGFLAYGHGFALIQHDFARQALLLLYSVMAHQYTRGAWLAPETRNVLMEGNAAPYCVPAQLFVPLMTRWMLVFEDPESETLWLGKVMPREWLADGKKISVSAAPTRWGPVSFSIASHLDSGGVVVDLDLPSGDAGKVHLRLRAPGGAKIHSVQANGKEWKQFDAGEETVTIPRDSGRHVRLEIRYR